MYQHSNDAVNVHKVGSFRTNKHTLLAARQLRSKRGTIHYNQLDTTKPLSLIEVAVLLFHPSLFSFHKVVLDVFPRFFRQYCVLTPITF